MCQWPVRFDNCNSHSYEFLISAHPLMMLYICAKSFENISKCFRVINTFCILKFTKGHIYVKTIGKVTLLFSAHCLLTLYICIKFQENIS